MPPPAPQNPVDFPSTEDWSIEQQLSNIHDEVYNSHGINFPAVGGKVEVDPSVHPELAAAAYTKDKAVIVNDGEAFLAPFDAIDTDAVELACNEEGCALIPDDGNPYNDIHPAENGII